MSLRILLVDDNHTFLSAVRQCLAMLPETEVVGQANDGPEALRLTESLKPDLVLLDIVMPHMNGLEVAAQIQAWKNAPHIVFLSLHDNESYRAAAHDLGVLAMVGKTNFVVDLMPIISNLISAQAKAAS
jgi:DNA-binding NarL/FixJ family response regulator